MLYRLFLMMAVSLGATVVAGLCPAEERPNILWLTVEDIGPHLGCYGDDYATTPHLDAFAARSLRYVNAWSTAPVCAPARTTLISGLYPPSTGSEHMRSLTRLPEGLEMYPELLREAGYFCVNPGKTDYNLQAPSDLWDRAERGRVWEQLKENQPFMAVFNDTRTHESRIRTRPHEQVLDPEQAPVPAYHPDTPVVRRDWAQYYDNITQMDLWFAEQIERLERSGLAENTIVIYYSDHGSGMPRHKRWPYNSGLHVPLIVHVPEKFRHLAPEDYAPGGTTDRIVGFIDLAPTVVSLAGEKPPEYLQGHAFLGRHIAPEPRYGFGFRGRMDERYDLVRTVRNKRYVYIRNYMPHKIYGQYIAYMFQTPTTQQWRDLYDAGELNEIQSAFWQTKPPEELYDLERDPDEVHNLVGSKEHLEILDELRQAHRDWVYEIRDVGFLPEDELHHRAPALAPYELGHDLERYPLERIFPMADKAASLEESLTDDLVQGLADDDSAVRYWAALGLLMRERDGVAAGREKLRRLLKQDDSPSVRTVAAEALGRYGDDEDLSPALEWLITAANAENHGAYVAIAALNALDELGEKARPLRDRIAALPQEGDWTPPRGRSYVPNLIKRILERLE
jgi:arylsulfatase A-like enzyme